MKTVALAVLAFSLLGAASPVADGSDATALSTDRRVHGVITSIEPAALTIASAQHAVTGKIDPNRTKITLNGKPGKPSDLHPSVHAKGELCVDDTWLVVDAH